MTGDEDDEALTWAGGRDPSHYETPEPTTAKPAQRAKASRAPIPSAVPAIDGDLDEDTRPSMSSAVLICLGILGGIYALYTVGWIVSWHRLFDNSADALELVAFQIEQVLAIVAAPLWFVVTLLFTRDRRPAVRLLWLVIGALVLVPWPFTLGR